MDVLAKTVIDSLYMHSEKEAVYIDVTSKIMYS
jgi:hypothetical protein